jgi:hypothetical protein
VAAINGWNDAGLPGVTLQGDSFDVANPRLSLGGCDLEHGTRSLVPPSLPKVHLLQPIGTAAPVDIVIKPAAGCVPLELLEITQVDTGGVSADIAAPPIRRNFHDSGTFPPCAITRHWIRTFSPQNPARITCVVESASAVPRIDDITDFLNSRTFFGLDPAMIHANLEKTFQRANEDPSTLLNPVDGGAPLWNDPHARFIFCMGQGNTGLGKDDVHHEMGHALTGMNHTLSDPDWFYLGELMHVGSGQPQNQTLQMTSQKVFIDALHKQPNGQWGVVMVDCANGYGQKARDGCLAPWKVNALAPTQDAW